MYIILKMWTTSSTELPSDKVGWAQGDSNHEPLG